jgi:hypothetical protein
MIRRSVWLTFGALIGINGVNYLYFLLLARKLEQHDFQLFSYAAAVVGLASAVAEAGMMYVAPPLLRARGGLRASRVAGAFLVISYSLLVSVVVLLAGALTAVRTEGLSLWWLMVYLGVVAPNIVLQPWVLARLRYGLALLCVATLLRVVGLFTVDSPEWFARIVAMTSAATILAMAISGLRDNAFGVPRRLDIKLCLRLLRGFVLLRAASVIVTAGVPFLLGLLQGPATVSWYLIGDRTRILFSAIFQLPVQALYLSVCRNETRTGLIGKVLSVPVIVGGLVASCVVATSLAGWINTTLYGSKYPDAHMLALFIVTGHVTVLSSIAYLIKLIPHGLGRYFIQAGLWSPVILVGALMFTHLDPLRVPAFAVLTTELFLCCYVWGAWWRHGRGFTASLSAG